MGQFPYLMQSIRSYLCVDRIGLTDHSEQEKMGACVITIQQTHDLGKTGPLGGLPMRRIMTWVQLDVVGRCSSIQHCMDVTSSKYRYW